MRINANGEVWLPKPDAKVEAQLDALYERVGPLRWKGPGPLAQAVSFISAVTSPATTDASFDARKAACLACPALVSNHRGNFCGACGCGQGARAELDNKLKMSRAKCPLGRWR